MSDTTQHIDVDTEEWENTPKALRDQVKKLQKTNTELTQQITEFKTEKVATALADVLAGFTKPERVKSALLADGIDPLDSEAVGAWIEENGNDFARAEGAPAAPEAEAAEEQGAEQATRARLDVSQFGQPGKPAADAVISSMPTDLGPAQALQWLREHQPSGS